MPAIVMHPPNDYYPSHRASVFLAGPIQDAPDWQAEAIAGLIDLPIVVSNPRTEAPWHGNFAAQVDWETWHLSAADVVLFWLARPAGLTANDRSYAQTSRFELGEWLAHACYGGHVNVVVGIEPGFHGERFIRHRLDNVRAGTVRGAFTTLPETVEAARHIIMGGR